MRAGDAAARGRGPTADVAWVVGTDYQGRGHAGEAAGLMARWLRAHDVTRLVAHVHPAHAASAAIARRIGLEATDEAVGGEPRFEG